jgi:hypothetical protein
MQKFQLEILIIVRPTQLCGGGQVALALMKATGKHSYQPFISEEKFGLTQ